MATTSKTPRKRTRNPDMADLAVELWKSSKDSNVELSSDAWNLIGDMLAFAADAKKKLDRKDKRIKTLEEMASTDELTGLLNRRGFEKALKRTLAAAQRHGETGVIAFIDIDGFKSINDIHGHEAGDLVLRHVAMLLNEQIRETDIVARIGGDEFALVLVRASTDPGMFRARSIRDSVNNSCIIYDKSRIEIEASFGIQPFDAAASAEEILRGADDRMYETKRNKQAKITHLRAVE